MNIAFPPPERLIDHRSVMSFVDGIESCDEALARCRATIRADNPFLVDGRLPNWVLIEYIAQSVAMFAGYRRSIEGAPHRHGLLLGCRSMTLADVVLEVGDRIETEVEEVVRLDDFGRFNGTARRDGEVLAQGALSVVETQSWPDPAGAMPASGG